jgi:hypothetical protein
MWLQTHTNQRQKKLEKGQTTDLQDNKFNAHTLL